MMPQQFPGNPRPARRIKRKRKVTANKGWTNTQKEMRGDEVLVELTGLVSGTRAQYLKGVWQYIKDKKLQHPWSKRIIIPDEKFAKLMGIRGHAIQVFTMLRCMERHYQKNEDGNGTAWRIQRIWEKVIFVPYPSWLLNLLNCKLNHLKLQKNLDLCENYWFEQVD